MKRAFCGYAATLSLPPFSNALLSSSSHSFAQPPFVSRGRRSARTTRTPSMPRAKSQEVPLSSPSHPSAFPLGLGSCVIVKMYDSFGDGWQGAMYTIADSEGMPQYVGTLSSGESSEDWLCSLGGWYTISVSGGDYPDEVSWEIIYDEEVIAEGRAWETVNIHIGDQPTSTPTSTPTITLLPTATSRPTYENEDHEALLALYTGTLDPAHPTTPHHTIRQS